MTLIKLFTNVLTVRIYHLHALSVMIAQCFTLKLKHLKTTEFKKLWCVCRPDCKAHQVEAIRNANMVNQNVIAGIVVEVVFVNMAD